MASSNPNFHVCGDHSGPDASASNKMKVLHGGALIVLIIAGIPLGTTWLTADWLCKRLSRAASYHYQKLFPAKGGFGNAS